MQIGDTKPLKRAVIALIIVASVFQLANFGSYYLGRYGFSFAPLFHGQDSLWWLFYQDAEKSVSGAIITATMVYLAPRRKRDESKSKGAA